MSKEIYVVKRSGERVPLDLGKIQKQIAYACEGLDGVSPSLIEINAQIQFFDGITTRMIDELILRSMVNLIGEPADDNEYANVNYQHAAGRYQLAMIRKDVYGGYEPLKLFDIVKTNVSAGFYTPELLEWYTEDEWNTIDSFIDHSKDEQLSYAAIAQLIEKYLVQNRVTKQIYETPQVRYAIAAATAFQAETEDRLTWVKDYYNYASDGAFTLATPVLAGLGTNTKQFSSCVLIRTNDSLDSIFATGEMIAKYASKRAGIGLEIGCMRAIDASIRGGEVKHTGILPFLKKFYADLRSCSQGGIRNASAAVYMPIWHYQFDDYIVLKNNQGTVETRVRQLDYAVVLSGFFWNRFLNEENITFFDPNDVPDLYEAFYKDSTLFEELYIKYEKNKKIRKKVVSAEVVFKDWILKERTDTGRIYLMNIDQIIDQTPFNVYDYPIRQSNLCTEILLPNESFERIEDDSGRIALCTLGSSNWAYFKTAKHMRRAMHVLVRSLSNILSYQDFLSVQSKLANDEFEPLGIGVTNLAYWHAKRKLKYGSPEGLAAVKEYMEHMNYYTLEATIQIAKERGSCTKWHTTRYAKGEFQWERRNKNVDELTDFTPSNTLDWEYLRAEMLKYGMRNATLIALPPVESSSVAINSTNGISLVKELITTKESKAGSFNQVVPGYHKHKDDYELMWDQRDCLPYLKTVAVLNAYTDQGISADTFYSPKYFEHGKIDINLITSNLIHCYNWGFKTHYYNLIEKTGIKEDTIVDLPSEEYESEEYCEACIL